MITVKTQIFVGFEFSKVCEVNYDEDNKPYEVNFKSSKIEKMIKKAFADKKIHPAEITPELVALLLDLEFTSIQDSNDALIGCSIKSLDIGEHFIAPCDIIDIQCSINKIKLSMKDVFPSKGLDSLIKIFLVGSVETPHETSEI
jgi:hypothetical protein